MAADALILQPFIASGWVNAYPAKLSFARPSRTYGLTTGVDALLSWSSASTACTPSLSGTLHTLWGQELRIERTCEIWVGGYPFLRGDVAWLPDISPIRPTITLDDPTGLLARVAPQVQPAVYCHPPNRLR